MDLEVGKPMQRETPGIPTLRQALDHAPRALGFGTSGRRGRVVDLTQLEIYINVRAELEYLLSLPPVQGGIRPGDRFFFGCDLRPSSSRYDPEADGRGEIAQAVEQAARDAGLSPEFLGWIPTPALTLHALAEGCGGVMVTGSHIPFDRNGYKTISSRGELRKEDEAPIGERVHAVRERICATPFSASPFAASGRFKDGSRPLPRAGPAARERYLRRYLEFFPDRPLTGRRVLVYEHSAVGAGLLAEVLEGLGARVHRAGRSGVFVPIDTENVDEGLVASIGRLAAAAGGAPFDALVSTDGDSDRPLILAADPATGRVRFFGGDRVGMIVAEYLGADAVVVPVSCNDAIDLSPLRARLEPKTRIGSPHVIAGMERALARGRLAVCGWEANGGFLLGSPLQRHGRVLAALPTRDAVLPIVCVLAAASEAGLPVAELFARQPRRFGAAGLVRGIARDAARACMRRLLPEDPRVLEVRFAPEGARAADQEGGELPIEREALARLEAVRAGLERLFEGSLNLGAIAAIDYTDGVRIRFSSGEVAHVRPSGNADEVRIYAVADTQERADRIVAAGVAVPGGIVLRLMADPAAG